MQKLERVYVCKRERERDRERERERERPRERETERDRQRDRPRETDKNAKTGFKVFLFFILHLQVCLPSLLSLYCKTVEIERGQKS